MTDEEMIREVKRRTLLKEAEMWESEATRLRESVGQILINAEQLEAFAKDSRNEAALIASAAKGVE